MLSILTKIKSGALLLLTASAVILSSCNKDLDQFADPNVQQPQTGLSLVGTLAATPNDTLFNRIITRSGLASTLDNRASGFTLFVADNNAVRSFVTAASGGLIPINAPAAIVFGFLNSSLPVASAAGIVSYYTLPQKFTTAQFVHPFPNLELPTNVIALPGNPLARLRAYVSKNPSTGFFYFNNVPLTGTDMIVGNSVIHHIAAVVPPPQRMIWERINTDSALTIFKAAITRADSGLTAASPGSLIGGLQNFGANFTVFAPTNAAMKATISALTGGLIPTAAPDSTFIKFLGSPLFSTLNAKGIVVYHFLGSRTAVGAAVAGIRAFSVNVPTTPIQVLTFLNNPGPAQSHPGVSLVATFTGPIAATFTVKGLLNATPSNVLLNSTPDLAPSYGATPASTNVKYTGTSDQHYVNGVLHYIDQVLRPL